MIRGGFWQSVTVSSFVLAGLWVGPSVSAQIAPGSQRPDTIRGLAYDSLAFRPMAGALITAEPGGESAASDSLGRFTIYSAQRVMRLVAFHERADRLGLGELIATRPAGDGAWERPIVATPGMNTAWTRLCLGQRRPANGMGGILFGSTMAADATTRVAGVGLVLQWQAVKSLLDTTPTFETMTVRSDSLGSYIFCGVQEFGPAALVASSSQFRTDNVLVGADAASLRRVDLLLGATAGPASTATVQGRVVDENGASVPAATVTFGGFKTEILSGPNGRFTISDVPTGSRMVSARKIGYVTVAKQLDVLERGVTGLEVLVEKGTLVEQVTIRSTRIKSRDATELDERKVSGLGRFVDSTHFAKYDRTRQALDLLPGIRTQVGRAPGDFVIRGRGDCMASLWVNAVREPNTPDNLIARLPKDEIAAVEIFNNEMQAPARFQTAGNQCAVVVLWTKQHISARR
ncbi:carboxypeptidase-like regulatory domain-containing protein [Gemmatimonas sp.]|uniref:carboxypeptidase-like regulatory domain-containing protein n=1 Tax=Gemmatimonas sp. TaxID=1962908 RepID=UPI003983691F